MKTVTFTQFRNHASGLFSDVENGEVLVVLRRGKPIAEVSPMSSSEECTPSWKKPGLKLTAKGTSLADAILEDRARWKNTVNVNC